jgi:hypothetical protein
MEISTAGNEGMILKEVSVVFQVGRIESSFHLPNDTN